MTLTWQQAKKIIDDAVFAHNRRHLDNKEVLILEYAWHNKKYDDIAAINPHYSLSYISQDAAPKLWQLLTEVLGEKVKKANVKQVIERYWENQSSSSEQNLIPQQQSLIRYQNTPQQESLTPDFYIERPPIERICYQTLIEPGSLLRIKAPSQMGKTSLMTTILAKLALENYRTISLSFELADRKTHFTNLDRLLRWFGTNITRELQLANQLDQYWDEQAIGSKVSCTTYFEQYLLTQTDSPIVLFLDDVDLLFSYPEISQDFFGLLRSWYEKARIRNLWKKLRLAIAHATEVYIPLNINQSPFNVGNPIELKDFTQTQIEQLAKQYGLDSNPDLVEQMINLVGGHPYLLQTVFSHLKTNPDLTLEQFLAIASTESGLYNNHLREYLLNLLANPELAAAFKNVVTATNPVQLKPMVAYKLHSMGLVNLQGNRATPRCNLYRQYFSDYLDDI